MFSFLEASSIETTNGMLVIRQCRCHPILALPIVAPPLPDVYGISCDSAWQVVVRPLAYDREVCRAVEHNERELRQVDLVDLMEDQACRSPASAVARSCA